MKENTKMEDKAKIERCKYSHPHFKNNSIEYHCVVDGWEDDKVRICKKGECESCQKFKSKYVEYPITVHEIENKPIDTSGLGHEEGSLVAIRPCAKEYNEKTYIGIYIGDLPIQNSLTSDPDCPFVLFIGHKKLIKRKPFEDFINNEFTQSL